MRIGGWMVSGWMAVLGLSALAVAGAETTESVFTRLAAKIPFVNYGNFLYQRPSWQKNDEPRIKIADEGLKEAMAVPPDLAELSALAGHSDPKVRTLAMMRLYSLCQPEAFVAIQARMVDKALTFPQQSIPCGLTPGEKIPLFTEDQTVSQLASRMMEMIQFPAPWLWDDDRHDFQKWSASRIGNPDWLGWYEFLFRLASRGTSPVPEDRAPTMTQLRSLMETRSPAVRTWFWFGLADNAWSLAGYDTTLATGMELIAAGKRLGPEALLAFLRDGSRAGLREPRLDDPSRGRSFVLSHASDFFRPQDAAALKEMGLFVAAADADPANASRLIRESLAVTTGSFDSWDHARAVAALADLRGDAEADFVVKWFYDAPVKSSQSSDQGVFLTELTRRGPKEWQKTVRRLVAETGFESLAGSDVFYVAILVNKVSGQEVVRPDMMTSGSEPEARNLLRRHFGLPVICYQRLEPVPLPASKPRWSIGLDSEAHSLAVSPDGKTVAVGLSEGGVRLFDTASGNPSGSLAMKDSRVIVRFGKSSERLLACDWKGVLSIWSLPDRTLLSETTLKLSGWNECDFNESVGLIAARGAPGEFNGISVMDLPGGQLRWTYKMPMRGGGIIGFSPDGQRVIAGDSFSHDLHLFNPNSSNPLAIMKGHSDVPSVAGFSPDGQWLVSLGDGKVHIWDGRTGAPLHEFLCQYGGAVGFTADSKRFLMRSDFRQITSFDLGTGKAVAGYDLPSGTVSHIQPAVDDKRIFMTLEGANGINFQPDKDGTTIIQLRMAGDGDAGPSARLVCWE